ncbi:SDR family NAD(P)-dependent oxidoreductase [Acidovorax sp. M2(2025)]|uniref:SDR family NAD(P)-dependent oxidoreductase n=1 Tax=Acidovorax sp. M2(2025) TaxID=3411355 RepID=UPI003BF5B2B2
MRTAETMASLPSLFDLTGQRALVTGAASGLGLAIAEALLDAGAQVVLSDSNAPALDAEVQRLRLTHAKVQQRVIDVSDGAEVDRHIDALAAEGPIDCVFANAGMSAGRGFLVEQGRLENVDPASWERVLQVNLSGVLATLRAAARHMKPRQQGRIIVTSSIAGLRSEANSGYAYVASKAAVNNLVRQAAIELAPFNVLVNAMAPGPFATGINGGRLRLPESAERMRTYIPLGRIAEPREIQGLALLLASRASSYMTGAIIPIDGGASAR